MCYPYFAAAVMMLVFAPAPKPASLSLIHLSKASPHESTLKIHCAKGQAYLSWMPMAGAVSYRINRLEGSKGFIESTFTTSYHDPKTPRPVCGYEVFGLDDEGHEVGRSTPAYAVNSTAAWGVANLESNIRIRTDENFAGIIIERPHGAPQAIKLAGIELDWVVQDVAVSPDNSILITISRSKLKDFSGWVLYDKKFHLITKHVGPSGKSTGQFRSPMGSGFGSNGDIVVADTGNNRLQRFDAKGKFLGVVAESEVRLPMKVTCDKAGRLLVADSGNNRVSIFTAESSGQYKLNSSLMSGMKEPCYVHVDGTGRVFVSTNRVAGVYLFNEKAELVWTYRGTDEEPVSGPRGLYFRNGELHFVDVSTNDVRVVKPLH